MSLYNMVFGMNPSAGLLLGMLGIEHGDVPRFRDCYLGVDSIIIHTRTGGGNRDYYESKESCKECYPEYFDGDEPPSGPWNDDLRLLPGYKYDRDDDFDSTYADFYFTPPEKFKAEIEILRDMGGERDPAKAWQDLFSALDKGNKDDPQVAKALTAMQPVMEKLTEFVKSA